MRRQRTWTTGPELAELIQTDERLSEQIRALAVPRGACLEWTGFKDRRGYGKLYFAGQGRRVTRLVWMQQHGYIPPDVKVRHQCDNPPCILLEHLSIGSDADNVADREARGRGAKGERHGSRVLTADQVREIRLLLAGGRLSHKQIGARYGVGRSCINSISDGTHWRSVT